MARLQKELEDLRDFRLLSLTVDPDNDTPEKLNIYAGNYGANAERWLFVSAPADMVEQFVMKRLKLGLEKNTASNATPGNKLLHSSKIVLVDRQGEIRGYFDGTNPEEVGALKSAVRQLHGQ
jgi:cytochrome oxidase Cu insertion factor (SCO1/SenC/PrrC family)